MLKFNTEYRFQYGTVFYYGRIYFAENVTIPNRVYPELGTIETVAYRVRRTTGETITLHECHIEKAEEIS